MNIVHTQKTRSVLKKFPQLKNNEQYFVGVPSSGHEKIMQKIGFSIPLVPGEQILPPADFGTACRYNAEGKIIIHKDKCKENVCRLREWEWKQWHGRNRVTRSKIVGIHYDRYPRTTIPPYAIEFTTIQKKDSDQTFLVSGPFMANAYDDERFTNTFNVYIEAFKTCMILDVDLNYWEKLKIKRLNWELLPPGINPWNTAGSTIKRMIGLLPKGNQSVIQFRFECIERFRPQSIMSGTAGFAGYLAFLFPERKICILESLVTNNATYVLALNSWEGVSTLSKAEILSGKLHIERLVHHVSWPLALKNLFEKYE